MARPDLLDIHYLAGTRFGELVAAVPTDAWTAATPCAEWDVRALVNHLVNEGWWAPELLDGRTMAEVGDRLDGDLLGHDPLGAFVAANEAARHALRAPGVLERRVLLSYGDEAAQEYVHQLTMDLVVHGWDLAQSIGADDTIDPDAVALLWEHWAPLETRLRSSHRFAEPVEVPADADPQVRLLALLGRRAPAAVET